MTTILQNKLGQGFLGHFLFALVIAITSFAYTEPVAAQDAAKIVVINQARLLNDSKAGKKLSEDAKKLNETISGELKSQFDSLKKEEEQLIAQQTLLSAEVLQERAQKLQINKQNFQIDQQLKQKELEASVQRGRTLIAQALKPIMDEMIEKYKPTILLDRNQLLFASPDINITAEVMKKLDESTPSVEFKRVEVKLAPPEGQQPAE